MTNRKILSPAQHCLVDYALVTSLLVVPSALRFKKKARLLYVAEAFTLLGYVALTDSPVAAKRVIPFKLHGKIDPFNVAQFALQTLLPSIRKKKKSMLFNIAFTAFAGLAVLLTDWDGPTR